MEERRTRQEYEKFLFDIDFWRLKIFLEIYMFVNSQFPKEQDHTCRWDAYCFPHTYFFSNFRCKMLVVVLVISQIGVVFLYTRHSWLHGYVQSHPVHICVIGITTIICKKDCIIQNEKIVSLFEGWMFIIRYIHDFQQRIKIFFPSAAMERRKARSFPRPWLPPRPPQDSSPSASTTQPPWRGWAKLDKENTHILWHLLSLENSYFSSLVLKPPPS